MTDQIAILVPPESIVQVDDFEFDLITSMGAVHTVTVSSYSRESESNADDHATKHPSTETVMGRLTDTPLGATQAVPGRARELLERLIAIQERLQPVRMSTTLSDYGDVIITEIRPQMSKEDGFSIAVNMTIQTVHIVTQEKAQIPPEFIESSVNHSTNPETEATNRQTDDPNEEEARQGSVLYNWTFGR